ncbi:MAG: DNA cytosine methyltransferase, partial [Propionibacteriaceae bacterium]|nr:DNA cytosine methyltransferase [Propionibacteriaceae bacterium]
RVADLSETDWTTFPTTDLLWASPSCVWHARSGGRKAAPESVELARETAGAIDRATAFAVVAAAEVHRYPVVIVENVPEFRAWVLYPQWLAMMGALGYRHREMVVNAADLGTPQSRVRLFVVFTRDEFTAAVPTLPTVPAATILDDLPYKRMDRPMYITPQVEQVTELGVPHLVMMRRNAKPRRADRHPVATVTSGGVHHYLAERTASGNWYRRFTPRELARAQGFPDDYVLTGTAAEQVRQIGNAVPVQVARWLGEQVATRTAVAA